MKASKSVAGRLGSLKLHATHDAKALTTNARLKVIENRYRRLEDQVDPDRVLSEAERAKRVKAANSEYMTRLRLKR